MSGNQAATVLAWRTIITHPKPQHGIQVLRWVDDGTLDNNQSGIEVVEVIVLLGVVK